MTTPPFWLALQNGVSKSHSQTYVYMGKSDSIEKWLQSISLTWCWIICSLLARKFLLSFVANLLDAPSYPPRLVGGVMLHSLPALILVRCHDYLRWTDNFWCHRLLASLNKPEGDWVGLRFTLAIRLCAFEDVPNNTVCLPSFTLRVFQQLGDSCAPNWRDRDRGFSAPVRSGPPIFRSDFPGV